MTNPALNIAVPAAIAAGKIALRYLDEVTAIPVTSKGRHDYVSEVDKACEAEIVREIRAVYPQHAFLAEESGADGDSEFRWIIDPLDGTSNFIHGIPHFAISIAQQVRGRTELGVIYDPVRDELFTASRGKGAYLNNRRIRVSKRNELDNAMLATAFPFRLRAHMPAYTKIFSELFKQIEDIRRGGSAALDLAYVAAARVDGFFELGLKPWDVAAGALLVREAGGAVGDFTGRDELETAGSVIAAPYKIMTAMQRITAKHWANAKAAAKP